MSPDTRPCLALTRSGALIGLTNGLWDAPERMALYRGRSACLFVPSPGPPYWLVSYDRFD
jgi:hypothetical protein